MTYSTLVMPRSLYIHWPFCPYKCHYCDFVALASHEEFMLEYYVALSKEVSSYLNTFHAPLELDTIYIGGGTPSTMPDDLMVGLFKILKSKTVFSQDYEVTIELNPGTIRPGSLALWQNLGINRVSIGVQSLKDEVLHGLNRHQRSADVFKVLKEASSYFPKLSIDLILGLPGVSDHVWKEMLGRLVQEPIGHISIYFLMIHEKTPLFIGVQTGKIVISGDDEQVELYHWTREFLASHGFAQYEISSFARTGQESRHNQVYWHRKPYKAFGLGASSFDGRVRSTALKNLTQYCRRLCEGKDVIDFAEELTPEQVFVERVMLGLRQMSGMTLEDMIADLEHAQQKIIIERINELQNQGLMRYNGKSLCLTPAALAVQNEVVHRLTKNIVID